MWKYTTECTTELSYLKTNPEETSARVKKIFLSEYDSVGKEKTNLALGKCNSSFH